VLYREAHTLLEELADATLDGTRKPFFAELTAVPLLIVDDLGMRKLPHTAAEDPRAGLHKIAVYALIWPCSEETTLGPASDRRSAQKVLFNHARAPSGSE
jgi:hypothetical protein